jgi:hypothetical protein
MEPAVGAALAAIHLINRYPLTAGLFASPASTPVTRATDSNHCFGFIPKDHPKFAEIMTVLSVTEPGAPDNAPR